MSRITDYKGKVVHIGIDVHKKTYHVTAVHKGEVIKKASVKAVPMDLVTSLKKWFKGARIFSVYEAGFAGFVLHRELERSGVKNIVINAASLEVAANDRVKTDSRDSEKMARQLSFGNLRPCRIPSVKQELSRLSHRTRDQLYIVSSMRHSS